MAAWIWWTCIALVAALAAERLWAMRRRELADRERCLKEIAQWREKYDEDENTRL